MSEAVLYQSILQKLGQINPNQLSQIDVYLSMLVKQTKPNKKKKESEPLSAIDYLVQLAEAGGVSSIENPIEWQRNNRQERTLPYK